MVLKEISCNTFYFVKDDVSLERYDFSTVSTLGTCVWSSKN